MEFNKLVELLKENGVNFAEYKIVKNKKSALDAAKEISYPVVIKIISKEILHKTDIGCLKLNIKDDLELEKAFDEVTKNAGNAKIDGYLIQKMSNPGLELIIGGKKDPVFGQVIVFGMGGIFVEVFKDVSMRVCPIKKSDAEEMISEIRGSALLHGIRGAKAVDVKSIINLLVNVSKMLDEHQEINELDINPIIAYPEGYVAVDARAL